MPAIVARAVIASRNTDPPSENLTNTALTIRTGGQFAEQRAITVAEFLLLNGPFHGLGERTAAVQMERSTSERPL